MIDVQEEILTELEGIHNILFAFFFAALVAASLYVVRHSGVSAAWLTN